MALIPVNVTIGDRTYRLKLNQSDEEVVRKSVKLINDKIVEYKSNLAGKDMQDYVSMVLLWFASQQQNSPNNIVQDKEAALELEHIESILQKALNP